MEDLAQLPRFWQGGLTGLTQFRTTEQLASMTAVSFSFFLLVSALALSSFVAADGTFEVESSHASNVGIQGNSIRELRFSWNDFLFRVGICQSDCSKPSGPLRCPCKSSGGSSSSGSSSKSSSSSSSTSTSTYYDNYATSSPYNRGSNPSSATTPTATRRFNPVALIASGILLSLLIGGYTMRSKIAAALGGRTLATASSAGPMGAASKAVAISEADEFAAGDNEPSIDETHESEGEYDEEEASALPPSKLAASSGAANERPKMRMFGGMSAAVGAAVNRIGMNRNADSKRAGLLPRSNGVASLPRLNHGGEATSSYAI